MEVLKLFINKRKKSVRIASSLEGRIFEVVTGVLIIGLWVLVTILSNRADNHPEMVRFVASVSDYIATYKMNIRVIAGFGTIVPIIICIAAYFPSAVNLPSIEIEPIHYGLVSRMLRTIAIEFILGMASIMLLIPQFGFSFAETTSVVMLLIMPLTMICFTVLISRKG